MNEFESQAEKEITQGEARQHIEAVRMQVMQMGGNDSENESLNRVVEQLENGAITPVEAMAQADGVRDSKQAYH